MNRYRIHEPALSLSWPGVIESESARAALDEALDHIRENPWVYQNPDLGTFELTLRAVNAYDETDFAVGTIRVEDPEDGSRDEEDGLLDLAPCMTAMQRLAAGQLPDEVMAALDVVSAIWVHDAVSRRLGRPMSSLNAAEIQDAARRVVQSVSSMGRPDWEE